ncbi:unnamed protein product, partial [Polarella glacialis]
YQSQCVEAAKDRNLLVVLPTNSGKTRIAAELLDHHLRLAASLKDLDAGGGLLLASRRKRRWCVFLAPTGPLAEQQGAVLAQHCAVEPADAESESDQDDPQESSIGGQPLRKIRSPGSGDGLARIGVLRGQQRLGPKGARRCLSGKRAWDRCDVLVMTPDLLLDALVHAWVRLEEIALLILDEAHSLRGNAAYALLMRRFYGTTHPEKRPRVLALSASPLSGRSGK